MSEHLTRAAAIFQEVAEAPSERRESLLTELCAGDAELRTLVERLLAHDRDGMPGFLRPSTRATQTGALPPCTVPLNLRIGPYQVLEVIAEGGMGTVYAARQSKPVERDVALKVIRAGMDSKHVIARFEAERQALALMDHPNIAKVLDAGETEQGQPYFVMELIHGVPITEYCDRRRLTTRERLELFRPVCEAVQHAHQKAVIHRDLKPSNVLVAEVDGRPLAKVIDFGVAKATARRLTERTMLTEQGVMIGTLEYMSPEQANLTSDDVDTRTDVYSLGVILYELLVGTLPFAARDVPGGGYEGIRRRILEEDPKRPSSRISAQDARSTDCARDRGTDAPTLRRQLKGDLDWIAMKALEKDRARRYASPMELAADIARHLQDEPVAAQPPTRVYRARKFIRRHRIGVAAAAIVTLALVAAVVGTSAGLVRARRAEATARTEQARSEKAATFLGGTLSGVDARHMGQTLGSTLRDRLARHGRATGRPAAAAEATAPDPVFEGVNLIDVVRSLVDDQILGKAVERVEKELKQDPALAADLYMAIGAAYSNLTLSPLAVKCYERAVELSERARGRDDATTTNMRISLANEYQALGRYRDAEKILLDVIDFLRRTRGEHAPETLIAQSRLGLIYQQEGQAIMPALSVDRGVRWPHQTDEAEALLRKTFEQMRRVLGEDDPKTLYTGHILGLSLQNQRRFAEAEALLHDVIARMERVQGRDHSDTINATLSLGSVFYYSGRFEEFEKLCLELLERSRKIGGEDSFLALVIEERLGIFYMEQGRYDEADVLLRDSARRLPRMMGEQSQFTLAANDALARLDSLRSRGRAPAAAK